MTKEEFATGKGTEFYNIFDVIHAYLVKNYAVFTASEKKS